MAKHHISTFIRKRIEEYKTTRKEVASHLNIAYNHLTAIIMRGRIPSSRKKLFSEYFEVDLETLDHLANLADHAPYQHPRRKIVTVDELGLPLKTDVLPLIRTLAQSNSKAISLEKFLLVVKMQLHSSCPLPKDFVTEILHHSS